MSNITDNSNSLSLQITLSLWTSFACVAGLIGNTFTLIATLQYKAITMDKVSILFIQNIAAGDLLYNLTYILPSAISQIAGYWPLGSFLCGLVSHFEFIGALSTSLFIVLISGFKLLMCLRPLRVAMFTKRRAVGVCGVVWAVSLTNTLLSFTAHPGRYYDSTLAICQSNLYKAESGVLFALLIIFNLIPMILIFSISTWLLVIASKYTHAHRTKTPSENSQDSSPNGLKSALQNLSTVTNSINKKALYTTLLISGLYFISWSPFIIYIITASIMGSSAPSWLALFGGYFSQINTWCNPIVYTCTNKRFAKFVMRMLCCRKSKASVYTNTHIVRNASVLVHEPVPVNTTEHGMNLSTALNESKGTS